MAVPLEVFCCYAREDQEMLEHLKKHLMSLQRNGQITVWSDTSLNAGVEWKKELHQHLESADIILLLISSYFIASDYCYSTEMKRAIERHDQGRTHVIPILLRPVHWEDTPFAKLQIIPTNAIPVTSWPDRDEALRDVIDHINRFLSVRQNLQRPRKNATTNKDKRNAPPKPPSRYLSRRTVLISGATTSVALAGGLTWWIWERFVPPPAHPLSVFRGHVSPINTLAWSPDSLLIASGSGDHTIQDDGYVRISNAMMGQQVSVYVGHRKTETTYCEIESVAWSSDGQKIASAGGDHTIQVWNAKTGEALSIYGDEFVHDAEWSPDGKYLAFADTSALHIRNVAAGNDIATYSFSPRTSSSYSIPNFAWSPDGKNITWVDFSSGKSVHIQDITTSGNIPDAATAAFSCFLRWAPDSNIIAVVSEDSKQGDLVDPPTGKIMLSFSQEEVISSLTWSPDSRYIATTCGMTVKIGKNVYTYRGHSDGVNTAAWSPNGKFIASGSSDKTVQVWQIS